ncbi:DUF397 domain-containing protein [Actinoplanes sp. NPDC049668]|uniref:DUF397 domain-containing protein n=1 Tax=unclassified Actinoplanes TaxID=2626549 RepID=UPI00339EDF1A
MQRGQFFTSSFTCSSGCVETAFLDDGDVQVRNTRDRAGAVLTFTAHEWYCFIMGVKDGQFDAPDGECNHPHHQSTSDRL